MAEWSAQRVRSRARAAVRKREENVEDDEMTSGELNLIPYLDMVTNLMLFILASVSAGLILSQINTTLPDKAPKGPDAQKPDQKPEEQPLGLYVSIGQSQIIVWSVSKREGTLKEPRARIPLLSNTTGKACDGAYMCETNNCDKGVCVPTTDVRQDVYDYRKLNDVLYTIAKTHYAGKLRKPDHYNIVLQGADNVPYSVIVAVMASMRCKFQPFGQAAKACLLPNANKEFKASGKPYDSEDPARRKSYNTEKVPYDPETMALFPLIQFSSGFE